MGTVDFFKDFKPLACFEIKESVVTKSLLFIIVQARSEGPHLAAKQGYHMPQVTSSYSLHTGSNQKLSLSKNFVTSPPERCSLWHISHKGEHWDISPTVMQVI
jgi:hypothetical protein